MSNVLQSFYILILNQTYRFTNKLGKHRRDFFIQLVCCSFPLIFVLSYSGVFHGTFMDPFPSRMAMGTILLILLILFSIDSPLHSIPWRKEIYIPLVFCGLGLIIIGFIHSIGEGFQLFGVQLVLVFPCLAFVWNNRGDYEKLFDAVARGFAFIGFLYCLIAMVLAAQGEFAILFGRWAGTMENANCLGMFGVQVFLSALYLFVRNLGKTSQLWYAMVAGTGLGFVFLSGSRVSFLVCVVSSIAFFVFIIIHRERNTSSQSRNAIIRYGLDVVLFAVLLIVVIIAIPSLQLKHDRDNAEGSGVIPSESTVTITDRLDVKESEGINSYSSGRIPLWESYARHLNLLGNDYDKTDWTQFYSGKDIGAHNLFLSISYRCGIPVGLLFIFLEVAVGIMAIIVLFNRRYSNPAYLFLILFVIEYSIESTLDIAVAPFSRASPLLFYIGMICIMPKDKIRTQNQSSVPQCRT